MHVQIPPVRKEWLISSRTYPIKDDYTFIGAAIGEGSYGVVRMARRKRDNVKRAVKIIMKSRVKRVDMLQREVDIMKRVDHPNIVKLYEVYEDDRYIYMIMELCEGGEVFDRMLELGTLTEDQAARLIFQMLSAINYLHSQDIAHRDIKPENFLFLNDSQNSPIKLIDFGFAKSMSLNNSMNTRAGTAYYVSPEVLTGIYGQKCDIWSIGVILYMLLSGQPPFDGEDDRQIIHNVRNGTYSFDFDIWEEVSDQAKDLIRQMLQVFPPNRVTAQEALSHEWFNILEEQSPCSPIRIDVQTLQNYQNFNKFKRLVINYIATQSNANEISELDRLFLKIDKDNNGTINFQEFKDAFLGTRLSEQEIDNIFNNMDVANKGTIDYSEFLAACLNRRIYMDEDKLQDAFRRFDLTGTGKIGPQDLKQILDRENLINDDEAWEKMIAEVDRDNDGAIDFHDFIGMMQQKIIECSSPLIRGIYS